MNSSFITDTGRCRRRQFENTLLVQSWRICFDDIELVNAKGKSKDASVSTQYMSSLVRKRDANLSKIARRVANISRFLLSVPFPPKSNPVNDHQSYTQILIPSQCGGRRDIQISVP